MRDCWVPNGGRTHETKFFGLYSFRSGSRTEELSGGKSWARLKPSQPLVLLPLALSLMVYVITTFITYRTQAINGWWKMPACYFRGRLCMVWMKTNKFAVRPVFQLVFDCLREDLWLVTINSRQFLSQLKVKGKLSHLNFLHAFSVYGVCYMHFPTALVSWLLLFFPLCLWFFRAITLLQFYVLSFHVSSLQPLFVNNSVGR